jgi:hypothetical protein
MNEEMMRLTEGLSAAENKLQQERGQKSPWTVSLLAQRSKDLDLEESRNSNRAPRSFLSVDPESVCEREVLRR